MPSKILYDTRDNSILRCQAEPKGSASLPSINALCKSARVSEENKQYMESIIVDGDYITRQAQEQLRIVELDNEIEVKEKPNLLLLVDYNEIFAGETIVLNLEITDTIESDNFQSVGMKINDVEFTVDIENDQGSKQIQLDEPDKYKITCNDHRLRSQSVTVEVI